MAAQIPLPFKTSDRYTFDVYMTGRNHEAVDYLKYIVEGGKGRNVYLWGSDGTGKSHLLHAVCAMVTHCRMQPAYIPLGQRDQVAPEILNGLEKLDIVCLDDLQAIAGVRKWELAVFNLYNSLADAGKPLVVAATKSPQGIQLRLPDLGSRLSAGLVFRLTRLDETDRLLALKQRASMRGFELPDDVLDFLSRRVARDMHSLFEWLDRLDEAALASQKKLTVPFVRELLMQEKHGK